MRHRQRATKALLWASLFNACGVSVAAAEAKPSVIRIGFPGVGVGNRPVSTNTALATAHLRGLYEEEFKPDGIQIQWNFLRGAGPAVNELYANGLLDFSHLGDLPSVIGRSSGLRYRLLAASSVRSNIYVSVPADSNVQRFKDLRGKRVAVTKGTATHLAAVKILERFGLTEKDVKLINMEQNPAQLALVTRDIDAAIGGSDYLRLRDQGVSAHHLHHARRRPGAHLEQQHHRFGGLPPEVSRDHDARAEGAAQSRASGWPRPDRRRSISSGPSPAPRSRRSAKTGTART